MFSESTVSGNSDQGGRYVLIVEKDTLQAHLLKVSLQEAGWVVRLADDPQTALLFCEHDLFDVAIINYNYPGDINGFILGEFLYTAYRLPSLMITAARYSALKKCPVFGEDQDVLFKPYLLAECRLRLQTLLSGVPFMREHCLGVGI